MNGNRNRAASTNGSVSALINNLNKNKNNDNSTVTPQRKMTGVSSMISKFNNNDNNSSSNNNNTNTSNSSTPSITSPPKPNFTINSNNTLSPPSSSSTNIKGSVTPNYLSSNPILKSPPTPVSLSAPTSPSPLSPRGNTLKPVPPPRCLSPQPPLQSSSSASVTPTLVSTNNTNKLPPRPWSPQPIQQNNNNDNSKPLPPRPWSPQPSQNNNSNNNNNNNNSNNNNNDNSRPLPPRPWSPQPPQNNNNSNNIENTNNIVNNSNNVNTPPKPLPPRPWSPQPPQNNNINNNRSQENIKTSVSPPVSPTISPTNSSNNLLQVKSNSNSNGNNTTTPPSISKRLHSTPEPINTNQISTTATTYNLSQPNASTMPPPATGTSKPSLPPRPWSINTSGNSPSNSRENSSNNITSTDSNISITTASSSTTTSTNSVKPLPKPSKPPLPKPSSSNSNNKPAEEINISSSSLDTPITFSDIRTMRQKTLTRKQATMKLVEGDNSNSNVNNNINNNGINNNTNCIVESTSNNEINELGGTSDDVSTDNSSSRNNSAEDLNSSNNNNSNNISLTNSKENVNNVSKDVLIKEKESSASSITSFITSHKKKGSFLFNNANATLKREQTLDLKGVLFEKIQEKHSQMVQNSTRKSKLPPINQSTSVNKVINEIIETEADYLDDLEIIINLYLFAAIELNKYKILSDQDIFNVFSNVEELYHISLKLYPMLLKTIPLLEDNQYPNIEEIFLYNSKAFQRYGNYLSSHENSIKVLNNLIESNSVIHSIFQSIKSLPLCKQLDLQSFLIKPCQRLCKYPLLLRELKKSVPESEESHHKNFERSVKLMEKIVNDINGKISNDEKIHSIIKDVGNISKENESLLWNQTFIKDSKMKKAFKKKKGYKDVTVYLLSQIILIFEKSTFKKKLIIIPLSKINSINDIEREHQFGVGINYNKDDGNTHNISLACDNYSHKLLWINDIDETIQTFKVLNGTYLYVTSHLQDNDNSNNNNNNNNTQSTLSQSTSSTSISSSTSSTSLSSNTTTQTA